MVRSVVLLIVIGLFVGVTCVYGDYPSDKLLKALAVQESHNNDKAVGDKKLTDHAYGHLQIRKPCIDDVNRKLGTHYKASDCLQNRELSELVCREYINLYATEKALGHKPTDADMARIWNGGPKGHKHRSTIAYWASVRKILRKL